MMAALSCTLALETFDAVSEYARFLGACDGEGAIASFTGATRARTAGGAAVQALLLDHHPRLTQASLEAIGGDALARFAIARIRIVHRGGGLVPGEPIVFVAAAAPHRRAALEAVDYVMDRLKTDAVFWKREDCAEGSRWIEPSTGDRAARARWED